MKRAAALVACRVAGYHDDTRTYVRTYVENRISKHAADAEWVRGQRMRENGVPCECFHCKREKGLI